MTWPEVDYQLDLYEIALRKRIGAAAARSHRREIEDHLRSEVAARMELGMEQTEAIAIAFAALGELQAVARSEAPMRTGERLTLFGPALAVTAFYAGGAPLARAPINPIICAGTVSLLLFGATVVALFRTRRPLLLHALAGGVIAFVAQTLSIELILRLQGYHPSYPLEPTLVGLATAISLSIGVHLLALLGASPWILIKRRRGLA